MAMTMAMTNITKATINNLPNEIIYEIADKLDTKDIVHLSMINKVLYITLEEKRNKYKGKVERKKYTRKNQFYAKLFKNIYKIKLLHPRRFYRLLKICGCKHYEYYFMCLICKSKVYIYELERYEPKSDFEVILNYAERCGIYVCSDHIEKIQTILKK